MSQLAHIKRRIKSIKTTQKITHAMRLISMSLYSKLEKERLALDYHKATLQRLFKNLSLHCPEWKNDRFFPTDILDANPLFIVISATKGFCGGLNNLLFRYTEQKLFIEEHQSPTFITIGKKATGFVAEKNFGPILATYHDLNSNNFPEIAALLTKTIMEAEQPYSSVTIYSSFFKNFFVQRPTISKLLPLQKEDDKPEEEQPDDAIIYADKHEEPSEIPPIWEQDKLTILNEAAQRYLDSQTIQILYQALVSEYAARFVAMDSATTNAENYLETLTLQFNKMRQALITREVSELSASL